MTFPWIQEKNVETEKSGVTMQFSEIKKEELIENVKKISGSDDVEVNYSLPRDSSSTGFLAVTFYLDIPPNKDKLENDLADIVTVSRQAAKESGITTPDINVVAMLKDVITPLGVGNYYSVTGNTHMHVEDI